MTLAPDLDLSRQTRIGILCAVGASVAFSVNDMAIKFLSGDYALHQVVMIRSLIGMTFMLALVVPFHGGLRALRTRHLGRQVARGLSSSSRTCAIFWRWPHCRWQIPW